MSLALSISALMRSGRSSTMATTTSSNRHQENAGRTAPVVRDVRRCRSFLLLLPFSHHLPCSSYHSFALGYETESPRSSSMPSTDIVFRFLQPLPASNLFLLNWPHFALLSDSAKASVFLPLKSLLTVSVTLRFFAKPHYRSSQR